VAFCQLHYWICSTFVDAAMIVPAEKSIEIKENERIFTLVDSSILDAMAIWQADALPIMSKRHSRHQTAWHAGSSEFDPCDLNEANTPSVLNPVEGDMPDRHTSQKKSHPWSPRRIGRRCHG
jgi:hypothetical protein